MNKHTISNIFLRTALAFVFLYAGIASFFSPADWVGFVPAWVESFGVSRELALQLHAAGDIGMGLWLISGLFRFWAGVFAFLWLLGIVAVSGAGLVLITFRDIGLALAALAYALQSKNGSK